MCACTCVCARARARVCAPRACARARVWEGLVCAASSGGGVLFQLLCARSHAHAPYQSVRACARALHTSTTHPAHASAPALRMTSSVFSHPVLRQGGHTSSKLSGAFIKSRFQTIGARALFLHTPHICTRRPRTTSTACFRPALKQPVRSSQQPYAVAP